MREAGLEKGNFWLWEIWPKLWSSVFLFLPPLQTASDLFLPTLSPYLSYFHSLSSSLRIPPPNSAALAKRWCPTHPTHALNS